MGNFWFVAFLHYIWKLYAIHISIVLYLNDLNKFSTSYFNMENEISANLNWMLWASLLNQHLNWNVRMLVCSVFFINYYFHSALIWNLEKQPKIFFSLFSTYCQFNNGMHKNVLVRGSIDCDYLNKWGEKRPSIFQCSHRDFAFLTSDMKIYVYARQNDGNKWIHFSYAD